MKAIIIGLKLAYLTGIGSLFFWTIGLDLILHIKGFIRDNENNMTLSMITKIGGARKTIAMTIVVCTALSALELWSAFL